MMDKTLKDFLNELKENDTKILNHDDFLSELKNTHERTFTGTLKTNMLTPKKGLVSIDMFLDNLFTYKEQGHFLSNSEIKELENDTTDYVYDNEWYTYNGGNFLAHDINMKMFLNDNGNYIVFLQVNTGVDTRSDFSSYIALKFDIKLDYENAFLDNDTTYTLASCLAKTQDGTVLNIEVISETFDYPATLYVDDENAFKNVFNTEIYDTDFDTIKDEVNEYIGSDKKLSKEYPIKEFTDYKGTVW